MSYNGLIPSKVIKRDGRQVEFDIDKVANAIFKAARAVGGQDKTTADQLAEKVIKEAVSWFGDKIPTVEGIQDIVEKVLIENGNVKTAKAYILYREQHAKIRDFRSIFDGDDLIDQYLGKLDWRINENSNMGFSLQGLNNYIVSSVVARYWLNCLYTPDIREAHTSGDIHLHDLGILSVYCCGWDLEDLLNQGFRGVPGKISSNAPKHFRSALGQIVNFFYTLQGEAAGAQAFSHFDTLLAPFVRRDKLSYADVKQGIQEFVFNLNIPTRVGFQTPFTNLTFDLEPPGMNSDNPELLANKYVSIGGEIQEDKYSDFQHEMDLINEAFADVMMEGDASGRIFTFPIPTYNLTRDLDWQSPGIMRVIEMAAKYGIPYFANYINSDMDPNDATSMCCRLRLDHRELHKRGGGLFGANPLTGSIGVATINLPRIGYLAKDIDHLKSTLKRMMFLCYSSLETKRQQLERFTYAGLYPFARHYLSAVKERTDNYWTNHFGTIGLVGMHECCLNFLGCGIDSDEGKAFSEEILDFMRDEVLNIQKESKGLFNLEATPAEGTSYRLAKLDRDKYPEIVNSGRITPYYTNSTNLPVGHTEDIFEALDHQDVMQTKYTGGTVFHAFLGERVVDIRAAASLIQKIAENYRLPYFTLTPTFSICPVHGYISGEHHTCPFEAEDHGEEEADVYLAKG
jgi:ribonucleoside-triphosphate reductase (formate)